MVCMDKIVTTDKEVIKKEIEKMFIKAKVFDDVNVWVTEAENIVFTLVIQGTNNKKEWYIKASDKKVLFDEWERLRGEWSKKTK